MTTITLPRAVVEQALEAMNEAVFSLYSPYTSETPEEKALYETIAAFRAALAQQAEPVDTDCPTQGICQRSGYGITQQVEPVAGVVLNEEGRAALVEHGREEWHCAARNARRLYTAPPQRLPLPKHDQHCVDVPGYGLVSVRLVRAIERAHGIKE